MARIRSVHPGLASDEAFMSMTMAAKAAWALLWTECDDKGVFEWKPVVLKARIFPADNVDFAVVLSEYEGLDCVKKFSIGGKSYGAVRNFCKFQRPKKPNSVHPLPDELRTYVHLNADSSAPVGNHSGTDVEKPPQMEDGGCSKVSGELTLSLTRGDGFAEFWEAYPKREGNANKAGAKMAYYAVIIDADPARVIAAASAYAGWCNAEKKTGGPYVKSAKAWLADGLWKEWEPKAASSVPLGVLVKPNTPQWTAWQEVKKTPVSERYGGWWFPTEWPPGHPNHTTGNSEAA